MCKIIKHILILHKIKQNKMITGCATLGNNDCNQVFMINGNESFTSLWRKSLQRNSATDDNLCMRFGFKKLDLNLDFD